MRRHRSSYRGTQSRRSSNGSGSRSGQTHRPSSRRQTRRPRSQPWFDLSVLVRVEILGIILLALAVLTCLSFISPNQGQITGSWLHLLRQGFGWGVYLTPIILSAIGLGLLMLGFGRLPAVRWERVLGLTLLLGALLGFSHLTVAATDPWQVVVEGRGGGLVGWLVGHGLEYAIGRVGAYVAVVALAFIALVLILGQSASEIGMAVVMSLDWLRGQISLWRLNRSRGIFPRERDYQVNQRGTPVEPELLPGPTMPRAPRTRVIGQDQEPQPQAQAQAVPEPSAAPVTKKMPEPSVQPLTRPVKAGAPWRLPHITDVLDDLTEQEISQAEIQYQVQTIEKTLDSFGVPARVVEVNQGPVITQFGVEPGFTTGRGGKQTKVKVSRISSLADDLSLALAASPIRIEAPVPGRSIVGIEVPNKEVAMVSLRGVMETQAFQKMRRKSLLPLALGENVSGEPIVADLTAMPHLLIAGATGSGKSVCINAIIAGFLCTNTPDTLQMIMVDPKRVELAGYNGIPHLLSPVVVDLEKVVGTLQWVTREMEQRYRRFAKVGARNIEDYNKRVVAGSEDRMPNIVVIIDELADLMMVAPEEAEKSICRIAQMARATGIHLVIATQRPSVDVVTGLIKANFPARISFMVTSSVDSRVIIDTVGAERLLGQGDMLFMSPDASQPMRLQGCFVSESELERLIGYWKQESERHRGEATPATSFIQSVLPMLQEMQEPQPEPLPGEEDEMLERAIDLIRSEGKASTTLLQRRLHIGYARAARIIEVLEERGVVGPDLGGSRGRDVIEN